MNPIDFQGHRWTLLLNLVNLIQTEPFQLGPSNLYARLVGTYYGMAQVSVRPSGHLSVGLSTNLVNTIETELMQLGPSNVVYILLMTRG